MRAKVTERLRARELRKSGYAVRHIALMLDVAVSSVSIWVRDIPAPGPDPLPEDELQLRTEAAGTKRCPRCGETLPLKSFNRLREGHQGWCRECFRVYFRERGDLHREQSGQAKRRRRAEARAYLRRYRQTHPCVDCGTTDIELLEFDHVGRKTRGVAHLAQEAASVETIRKEISQCDVVCANCHRRRTALQIGSWRSDPSLIESSTHLLPGEKRNLRMVADLLGRSSCADCGEDDFSVLEFDHVRGKTAHVGELARSGCSVERLLREISRCEIRCANCHRKRTFRVAREERQDLAADPDIPT